jgi:hypothetical protein
MTTNPFFLQSLLTLCLDFAMAAAGEGGKVGLSAEESKDRALVRFTGVEGVSEVSSKAFPGEREKALLCALKGKLAVMTEAGELVLSLSKDIRQDA